MTVIVGLKHKGSLFSYDNVDPVKRINKAIDAAKAFSNGCGGETKIIKVG